MAEFWAPIIPDPRITERAIAQREALARLQREAATNPVVADLLLLLGVSDG